MHLTFQTSQQAAAASSSQMREVALFGYSRGEHVLRHFIALKATKKLMLRTDWKYDYSDILPIHKTFINNITRHHWSTDHM